MAAYEEEVKELIAELSEEMELCRRRALPKCKDNFIELADFAVALIRDYSEELIMSDPAFCEKIRRFIFEHPSAIATSPLLILQPAMWVLCE